MPRTRLSNRPVIRGGAPPGSERETAPSWEARGGNSDQEGSGKPNFTPAPRRDANNFVASDARRRLGKLKTHEWGPKPKRKHKNKLSYAERMWEAVRKFLIWQFNGPVDTDDGEFILDVVMPLLVQIDREQEKPDGWIVREAKAILPRLPWSDEAWVAREISRAKKAKGMTADMIAERLPIRTERDLDDCFGTDKRKRSGLVSLQRPKRIRTTERKAYRATWMKAKRKAQGVTPREQSASRTKPWIAAGFKTRRTWERHGKPSVANSCINPLETQDGARDCDSAPSTKKVEDEPAKNGKGSPQRCTNGARHTHLPTGYSARSTTERDLYRAQLGSSKLGSREKRHQVGE